MEAGTHADQRSGFDAFLPGRAEDFVRMLGAWSVPVALLDGNDVILFWNRGAVVYYGVSEAEALGKKFCDLVGEDSSITQAPAAGMRTRRYEASHRSAAGLTRPVIVMRTDLPTENGSEGAFVLITDLTESKELERRLARRVAQLSVIREIGECLQSAMSPERILRTILIGATASVGLRFNRAFLLLVDERHGMLRGRDGIGPADVADAEAIWTRLARGERTLRDLVNDEPPVEGHEPRVLEIARRLSAKLDDAEAFVVRALTAKRTTRVAGGQVVDGIVPAPRDIIEVLGVDDFVAVPSLDGRQAGRAVAGGHAITRRAITQEDVEILELLGLQAAEALARANLTEELARQVASLEAATRELRSNHERMVRSERLSAIGEMAARVAHEIRNPLVAIGGFARSLLLRSAEQDSSTRESLEIIVNEVRRLESIVREVLEFSRPAPPKIGSVCLRRVAEEALDLLSWELDHAGVVGRVEEAPGTPAAAADGDQIFQAVINLLRNGVHAMPEGGELVVSLRGVPYGVEMAIVDTGVGMTEDVLAHALEPFFTTKTNGSGLGLTIAAQIAGDHKGEVRIESREGEGTTVALRLPRRRKGTTMSKILVIETKRICAPSTSRTSSATASRLSRRRRLSTASPWSRPKSRISSSWTSVCRGWMDSRP
jgi:PAS domain S-box-containing protein